MQIREKVIHAPVPAVVVEREEQPEVGILTRADDLICGLEGIVLPESQLVGGIHIV